MKITKVQYTSVSSEAIFGYIKYTTFWGSLRTASIVLNVSWINDQNCRSYSTYFQRISNGKPILNAAAAKELVRQFEIEQAIKQQKDGIDH